MDKPYKEYLKFLGTLADTLDKLIDIAREKAAAVRQDDLAELNECIKKEQAVSLSMRSLDKKRDAMLAQLGLADVPLSALAGNYPEDLRLEAKAAVERVRDTYSVYTSAAEAARTTLECNLHEIEKIINGEQTPAPAEPELPVPMRTDIRA